MTGVKWKCRNNHSQMFVSAKHKKHIQQLITIVTNTLVTVYSAATLSPDGFHISENHLKATSDVELQPFAINHTGIM